MWSTVRGSLAVAVVTLLFGTPVSGQGKMASDQGLPLVTSPMRASTPTLPSDVPTTIDLAVSRSVTALLPLAMERQSQNVALMIVGGAAMIVGSAVAGDTGTVVIAVGGVLGLVGLFRYLN